MFCPRKWFAVIFSCALGIGVYAQQKKQQEVQKAVRAAGLQYFANLVYGDASEYLKVTRMPLLLMRDGMLTNRTEAETRALLAGFAERQKKTHPSDEDRKKLAAALVAIFDDASIEFVGANTAALTFITKHGAKESDGDSLATLILYKSGGQWKVIQEITDSAAVPASYID